MDLQWLVNHGCLELVLEPFGKSDSCRFGITRMIFLFLLKMVYCVYLLELPLEAILIRTHNIEN